MKYALYLLLLSSFLFSCSEDPAIDTAPTLVGSWELIEVCFSIGTGTCTEEKPDYIETISFTETGILELVRDNEVCAASYTYDGGENLDLEADNNVCNFDVVTYRVSELSETMLILHPPCREACTQTYRRI